VYRRRNSTRVALAGWAPMRWVAGARWRPIDTLRCRPAKLILVLVEARERSPGEIPARFSLEYPGRVNPKGAASSRCAKHAFGCQGLSEGSKPRNRGWSGWFPLLAEASPTGGTVGGSNRFGNVRWPFERGKLRRANPRSAAGVKQSQQGLEGRKPPRGEPNPEGGT
jgi:hypothetical protein